MNRKFLKVKTYYYERKEIFVHGYVFFIKFHWILSDARLLQGSLFGVVIDISAALIIE